MKKNKIIRKKKKKNKRRLEILQLKIKTEAKKDGLTKASKLGLVMTIELSCLGLNLKRKPI